MTSTSSNRDIGDKPECKLYEPLCGIDNITYTNLCAAQTAGIDKKKLKILAKLPNPIVLSHFYLWIIIKVRRVYFIDTYEYLVFPIGQTNIWKNYSLY